MPAHKDIYDTHVLDTDADIGPRTYLHYTLSLVFRPLMLWPLLLPPA